MERHWWGNTLQSLFIHCWDSLQRHSEAKSPFFKRRQDLESRLLGFLFMHISLTLPWWISIREGRKLKWCKLLMSLSSRGGICIIPWKVLGRLFSRFFYFLFRYVHTAPWIRFSLRPLFHVHHSTAWFMGTIRSAAGKNLQTSARAIVYCSQDVVETLSPGPTDPELWSLRLRASVFKSTVSGKDGRKQSQNLKP